MLIDGSPVRTQERVAEPKKDLNAPASVVKDYIAPAPGRHVPEMLLATTLVAVLPLVVSLGLRASGLVSGWVSVGLAVTMSLVSSTAGSAYWRRRGGNSEVLFGELLLWGWVRSWRQERELANATRLLHLVHTSPTSSEVRDELSVEQREHLLQQLAGALEGQDVYLNGHSRRVARHATMIARGMGLPNEEVARIRAAAAVHDVGKLLTPKAVLNKPGRLTDEEFAVIKCHPVDGAEMVAALGDPELTRIVRHHHERLDGAGYPHGLSGEAIPLGARIIAVADTFDAITSARPYRAAAPHQKAIDILRKEAGTQLDPDAVRSFLAYYSGSRPTMVWAIITSTLRRIVSWLSGDPAAAATISASKVAAATAVTATIGAVAGAAPVPVVHHHPSRPAVVHVHASATRAHATTTALRRQVVSVAAPARAGTASAHRTKPAAAKARRHATHAAATRRHAGQPKAGSRAHSRAAGAGSTTSSRPASSTSKPAAPTHTTQSQGSNANGNAYGHTKPLGNGNGNGLAKGHGNSGSSGSSHVHAPSIPIPTVHVPATSNAGGQSASHANGQGNQGNGDSQGNGANHSAVTVPVTVPVPAVVPTPHTPSSPGSQGDQGNANGNDQSNGSTAGHGNGHGNSNGD